MIGSKATVKIYDCFYDFFQLKNDVKTTWINWQQKI